MATLAQLRTGLATNLRAGVADMQVSEYLLSTPTPPAADLTLAGVEYDRAMGGGLRVWTFAVRAFVGFTSDVGAQKRLDAFMDADSGTSFKAALESDPTLGGVASDVHVASAGAPQLYLREQGQAVWGAEFSVMVYA